MASLASYSSWLTKARCRAGLPRFQGTARRGEFVRSLFSGLTVLLLRTLDRVGREAVSEPVQQPLTGHGDNQLTLGHCVVQVLRHAGGDAAAAVLPGAVH
jgi:hypothetical protein